uniref:Solute carrier family 15 member 1a n=1 Tax=Sinocyclocheilus anshuiensis TaxID=1608454 RepID=A0A671RUT3_9TELE
MPLIQTAECCGYPISIFFIVVHEFSTLSLCLAVLVLYFRYFLLCDDDLATSIYHAFVVLCYLAPILGAIIADSWLGKFNTIHDLTDANRDGTPDNFTFHIALSMLGLILIALGTGGIKPCVAAFGGDQFQEHQSRQLNTFFSVFYLCINAGSLLSTLITPVLRAQECGIHTQQQCYPLTFGVPAPLMVVSLVVFIAGSGMYVKTDPEGNIMWSVCKCIGFAIKNRFRHRSSRYPKREHWMDWANKLLIAQIKMVLKVLFLYIPLPMFWTLFDQKGSRWTHPATSTNRDFVIRLKSLLCLTVNPILILTLVPIMDRMTVGMLFAAMAFVSAALVQIEIDKTLPNFPSSSESQLKVVNMYSRTLNVTISPNEHLLIESFGVQLHTSKHTYSAMSCIFVNGWTADLNITNLDSIEPSATTNYTLVNQGKRDFVLRHGEQWCEFSRKFGFGASYTFLIPSTVFSSDVSHMALQIPQYFLITSGEVMFSVTGLQFSYSQAPKNMKSMLQASWLCTNAVGNIIVLIVAELGKLPKQYVLFASLLVAVSIIFSIMAYFYTYIDPAEIEAQIRKEQGLEPEETEKETLEIEGKDEDQKNEQEVKQTKI